MHIATNLAALRNAWSALPLTITLLLIICVTLIVGNAVSLWANLNEIEDAGAAVNQTWTVIDTVRSVQSRLTVAESSQRGYLLSGDSAYLEDFAPVMTEMPGLLRTLELAFTSDPAQAARYIRLRESINAKLEEMASTISLYAEHGLAPAIDLVHTDTGMKLMKEVAGLLAAIDAAERDKLRAKNERSFERFRVTTTLGLIIGTVTLLILLLYYGHIARSVLQRRNAEARLRAANETLEAKVAARTAQLSHLSRYLLQLAETEKAALANELHDELGSNLTAINLDVTAVATRLKTREPALAERLNRALDVLHQSVDIKRRIIQGLRPSMLDSLGLSAALRMHCEELSRRTELKCEADCPDDFPDVGPSVAIALYRVAQESLNNIIKYARAGHVQVKLESDSRHIRLQIVDDGVGIDPDVTDKPMAHGILGMRERVAQLGGSFSVRVGDGGSGTIVEAQVPIRR